MKKFVLLGWLLPLSLSAQLELAVGTELGGKFSLAVDSVVQTPPGGVSRFGLKTETNRLFLQLLYWEGRDSVFLIREINLPAPGKYAYVVVKLPDGRYRLRYRSQASWASALTYVPVKKGGVVFRPKEDTAVVAGTTPQPDTIAVPAVTDTSRAALPEPVTEPVAETPLPETPASADSLVAKPMDLLLAEVRGKTYEFEKIQVALEGASRLDLKPEEVVLLLRELRFDQSKLELIKRLPEKARAGLQAEELQSALDYETSRQMLRELLK